jgi:hypothetical protein
MNHTAIEEAMLTDAATVVALSTTNVPQAHSYAGLLAPIPNAQTVLQAIDVLHRLRPKVRLARY